MLHNKESEHWHFTPLDISSVDLDECLFLGLPLTQANTSWTHISVGIVVEVVADIV